MRYSRRDHSPPTKRCRSDSPPNECYKVRFEERELQSYQEYEAGYRGGHKKRHRMSDQGRNQESYEGLNNAGCLDHYPRDASHSYNRDNQDSYHKDNDSYRNNSRETYSRDKQNSYRRDSESYRDDNRNSYSRDKQNSYCRDDDSYRNNNHDTYSRDKQNSYRRDSESYRNDNRNSYSRDNQNSYRRDNDRYRNNNSDTYSRDNQDSYRNDNHDSYRRDNQNSYRGDNDSYHTDNCNSYSRDSNRRDNSSYHSDNRDNYRRDNQDSYERNNDDTQNNYHRENSSNQDRDCSYRGRNRGNSSRPNQHTYQRGHDHNRVDSPKDRVQQDRYGEDNQGSYSAHQKRSTPVLIIGHSFVQRAATHMENKGIRNLYLPCNDFTVTLQGRGGAYAHNLPELYDSCDITPHLALIDIGTNDLSNFNTTQQATKVAQRVFDFGCTLVERGVKYVIILEILPRACHGRYSAPPFFSTLVQAYNWHIQELIHQNNESVPISYWFHSALASKTESYIKDGVHLNNGGISRYLRSLKKAILTYSAVLNCDKSQQEEARDKHRRHRKTPEDHHDEEHGPERLMIRITSPVPYRESQNKPSSEPEIPVQLKTEQTNGKPDGPPRQNLKRKRSEKSNADKSTHEDSGYQTNNSKDDNLDEAPVSSDNSRYAINNDILSLDDESYFTPDYYEDM